MQNFSDLVVDDNQEFKRTLHRLTPTYVFLSRTVFWSEMCDLYFGPEFSTWLLGYYAYVSCVVIC